jgi:hypothetical protein
MNERRDDWAQAFGESVGIVAIGFRLLGIPKMTPRAFAARNAALVRAEIMRRSFSASAA